MLDILLKTLVCNYLHWNFFPAIFVLHLLIFNPFCTRFYFVCVCVCVLCVCVCVCVCLLFQNTSVWRSFVLHSVEPVPFCAVPFWQYASVSTLFLSCILLSSLLSIILLLLFYDSLDLLFFDILVWSAIRSIKKSIFTNSAYSYYEILQDKQ